MEAAPFDAVAYLTDKGYQPSRGSGREVRFPCPFDCGESPDSSKKKLYVNAEDGWYYCFVCQAKGGPYLLMKHFGDDPKAADFDGNNNSVERRRILEMATSMGQEMLHRNDELLEYLIERGLDPETIEDRRLGYAPGEPWSLVGCLPAEIGRDDIARTGLVYRDGKRAGENVFYDHLLIPYISQGQVTQMRGRKIGGDNSGRYMTGPGERVQIYNSDDLHQRDILITEGEFDCMILRQELDKSGDDRLKGIGVIALPGVNALPENFEALLSNARLVYVGFDSDEAGRRGALALKERLGNKVRVLSFPERAIAEARKFSQKKVDWTDFFVKLGGTLDEVSAMIRQAAGRRLATIYEVAESWRNSKRDQIGIKLGFSKLDSLIAPGMLPGQLMIPLAKSGTGKTIFLCNITYNTRDIPQIMVSLEMTSEEVYERLRRIYLFHHPMSNERDVEAAYSKLLICDENRLKEQDISALCEEYEIEMGVAPQLLQVDYLGYYARGVQGKSPYEKTSNAVMQLKAEAKAAALAVIAPHQVNRNFAPGKPIDADAARDSGVVEETGDFVIGISRPDDALQQSNKNGPPNAAIEGLIAKSRHGGKGRTFHLKMGLLSLVMVDDFTDAAKRVEQENYLAWRGYDYEQLRLETLNQDK